MSVQGRLPGLHRPCGRLSGPPIPWRTRGPGRRRLQAVAELQVPSDGLPQQPARPPSPYASRPAPAPTSTDELQAPPQPPTPQQQQPPSQQQQQQQLQLQQQASLPALRGSSSSGPPAPLTWVPISGPPSNDPPEMRHMQHPADAPEAAPTSIAEVATQQQLAIGKREAREQAVALATARAEMERVRAVAEAAVAREQLRVERNREIEAQRNESMAINRELLAGYKRMVAELESKNQQLTQHQLNAAGFQQQLLELRSWVDVEPRGPLPQAPGPDGPAPSGGGDGVDLASVTVGQLVQLSGQLAQDAERDDRRRQQLKTSLTDPQPGSGTAAAAAADLTAASSNSSGNGATTAGIGSTSSPAAGAPQSGTGDGASFTPARGSAASA